MALYALALSPMIQRLDQSCPSTKQSWYADDGAAADDLMSLRRYCKVLEEIGPGYGYFPNARKTVLPTKPEHLDTAQHIFADTGMTVTSTGCRYLGGFLGPAELRREHMANFAARWATELEHLSQMAQTQPQAAYTVFTKCLSGRWRYHLRCSDCDPACLQGVDGAISSALLLALLGHEVPDGTPFRELLSFPARFIGLAIPELGRAAAAEHAASVTVTKPLVELAVPPEVTGSRRQSADGERNNEPALPASPDGSEVDPTRVAGSGPSPS